ncbi:hypothetical protein PACTADRAFT_74692 [Pachysolen tannophilus NRRL Y-2460]|uniref:SEC7 domain-containing protein n=1 Tax=Pachysolen tannophilus NRRL Y-2460 TaxID=669874 RepID=A0A1E4TZG3_PACTA|nr:hypothetical protein PACTADRAFT_74692 [Pachysolen tannophilus NRRL Y-2460]
MENSHTFSPDPNLPTPSSDHGFIQEDVLVDDFTFPSPNMATSATASLPITPSSGSNNSLSFLTSQFPLENETPETYINRLVINNKIQKIIQLITTKDSEFNKSALDYYFNYYDFKNEVIDLSLRKFLILNELPKETQQIDRVIREFANHFYIQNQEIVYSVELCYILTFSLLVLHTDYFNPNNKKKMSKFDFVKIIIDNLENHYKDHEEFSKLEDSNELLMKNLISKEILEYYYDNITYTPFKRFEENLLNLLLRSNNNKGLELLKNDKNLSKSQKDSLMKDSNHKFTNTNVNKNEEEITRSIIRSNLSNSSMTSTSRRRASMFMNMY